MVTLKGVEHITFVDRQPETTVVADHCKERRIKTRTCASDVNIFFGVDKHKYDFIYVDLYEPDRHSGLVQTVAFWEQIADRLSNAGVVALNSFDVPVYLFPELGTTITTTIARSMMSVFRARLLSARTPQRPTHGLRSATATPTNTVAQCLARWINLLLQHAYHEPHTSGSSSGVRSGDPLRLLNRILGRLRRWSGSLTRDASRSASISQIVSARCSRTTAFENLASWVLSSRSCI